MDRVSDVAAAVESTADALVCVLEAAGTAQSPGVPPAQLRVLTIVAQNRHTNMSRLAEALEVVPSSASRLCDRLVASGMVERSPGRVDRREIALFLTPSSRQLLDHLRTTRRELLTDVLERMTPAGRAALLRGLTEFAAAAAVADETPGSTARSA